MIPVVINWQTMCAELMKKRGWNCKQMAAALGLKYHTAYALASGGSLEPHWHTGVAVFNAHHKAFTEQEQ